MKKYLVFLLLPLVFFSCKQDVESAASVADKIDKRTLVEFGKVEQRTEAVPINAIGRLASDKEVRLSFKIGGYIEYMNTDEGKRVQKGQLLASLRTTEIDAQVRKAQKALDKNQRDLQRIQKMYAEEAATLENVQDLTTAVEVAQADLEIAIFNQKYAQISSPVSGRVLKRLAEPNELVGPGQPVFLIASSEGKSFVMKVALSDRDIARVNYGDKAVAQFDAFPNENFNGQVTLVAESADPRTGTFEVDLGIAAKGKRLRNGYIGRVEITPKSTRPYFTIPMEALVEANDQFITVFVPTNNDQTVKEMQVKPLYIYSDYVAIEAPENDDFTRVVTKGAPYLIDGDSIRVKMESK